MTSAAVAVLVLTVLAVTGCGGTGGEPETAKGGSTGVTSTIERGGTERGGTESDGSESGGTVGSGMRRPDDPHPSGTFGVATVERTYVDHSRPTAAHGDRPELSSRTIRSVIMYPTVAEPDASEPLPGPWPTIVFAHGSTRKAEDYAATLEWWVSAGYVVVAPNFPLSTEGTPGGTKYDDYPSQSADESFVIDSVLADHGDSVDVGALVDPSRIGLGGQSLGAITTEGTATTKCCADARVKAATEFAGMFLPYPSGDELSPTASEVPLLFIHGDDDPTVPYAVDHAFFQRLGAPGGFLTIVGGGHDDGYFKGGSTPLDLLISEVTLAFYDQHLKGDPTAAERLARLVSDAGPQVVTFEPGT